VGRRWRLLQTRRASRRNQRQLPEPAEMSPGKASTLAIGKLDTEVKTKLRLDRSPAFGHLNRPVLVLELSSCPSLSNRGARFWPVSGSINRVERVHKGSLSLAAPTKRLTANVKRQTSLPHALWDRIFDKNCWARSVPGALKKSVLGLSSTISPLSMKITRSATSRAKPISWVTTIIVIPS